MKYIRTRDGIFEFAKRFNLEHYRNVGFSDEDIVKKFIRNGNKIADTIEELCDYCLYYNCYDDFVIRKVPLSTSLESLYRDMQYKLVKDIKLAIKTDKGIIYVAKMNDKGELELL